MAGILYEREGADRLTEVVENVTNGTNLTSVVEGMDNPPFIYSGFAYTISGAFVWSALLLTCFQVR